MGKEMNRKEVDGAERGAPGVKVRRQMRQLGSCRLVLQCAPINDERCHQPDVSITGLRYILSVIFTHNANNLSAYSVTETAIFYRSRYLRTVINYIVLV